MFRKKIAAHKFEAASKKLSSSLVEVEAEFPHVDKIFVADFTAQSLSTKRGFAPILMRRVFRLIQRFVDTAEHLGCHRYEVYSDIMFAYPRSQRFLNLPHLPITMPGDPSARKLGKWQLSSLGITVRNSQLGLSKVDLAFRNGKQTLDIHASMNVATASRLPERVYSKSLSIASLFLV
jgi:hypothetical protein